MTATVGPAALDLFQLLPNSRVSQPVVAAFRVRQVCHFPHSAGAAVDESLDPTGLFSDDAVIVASHIDGSLDYFLADGADAAYLVTVKAGVTHITVAAATPELARTRLGGCLDRTPRLQPGAITLACWRRTASGDALRDDRPLACPRWNEIADNYPPAVAAQLEPLIARHGIDADAGRLVVLHGEPGTGKTTFVRSLMRAWSPWADPHLITDPERLFTDPGYLFTVLASSRLAERQRPGEPRGPRRWKLVAVEDADGYLSTRAREHAGASLGRLLNATDGIIGATSRSIFVLTTNEAVTSLHPALTRPGRCLAAIDVRRFNQHEAAGWLGADAPAPAGGATLAELYALRDGQAVIANQPTGTYL